MILQNLRLMTGSIADGAFLVINSLGDGIVAYLLVAFIYWCMDKRLGQIMALNVSLATWGNQWVRKLLRVERPWIVNPDIRPVQAAIDSATGYSLPSAGTQKAIASWGVYGRYTSVKIRKILITIILALVVMSGPYLGTHSAWDELAAIAMGLILIFISDRLFSFIEKRGGYYDIFFCIIACIIFTIPYLNMGLISNAGISYGLIIGITLEKRWLDFKIPDKWPLRIIRFIIGAAVVALLYWSTNYFAMIVPQGYEDFAVNIVAAFFISYIYPLIFTKWEAGDRKSLFVGLMQTLSAIALIVAGIKGYNYFVYSNNSFVVVAEGGYSAIAPANTANAIEDALDIGADYIELDLQMTKDGQIVVYSDRSLYSATASLGGVSQYTLQELENMDLSTSFDGGQSSINYYDGLENYLDSKILTLNEALREVKKGESGIIIRFLDYSHDLSNTSFVEDAMDTVAGSFILTDVIYATDDYLKIRQIKNNNANATTFFVLDGKDLKTAINRTQADYYGLSLDEMTSDTVAVIHEAGASCYILGVEATEDMARAIELEADGICTGAVGRAKVLMKENAGFLADKSIRSITVPTLYDDLTSGEYKNFILQGMTKVDDYLLLSAYDSTGRKNSCIYMLSSEGRLMRIFDLGFKAHLGGIAYDETNNLLWITASRGQVYALDWEALTLDNMVTVTFQFDAGLYNHAGEHVASFLTICEGQLYVGSYCIGQSGLMNQYDIADLLENADATPKLKYSIPVKVQGVAFTEGTDKRIIFTQSAGYKNSHLLIDDFTYGNLDYSQVATTIDMPCMIEQPYMADEGLYILFESSAWKYRAVFRVPNDQVWLVDIN